MTGAPVGKISLPSSLLRVPECFVQDDRLAGHVSWRDGERGLLLVSCLVNEGKLEESSGEQLH